MGQIRVTKDLNGMSGLCLIEPALHGDSRGYFMETYNERDMEEAGISIRFVQDNQSFGKWHGEILSADNRKQFLIPRGFAHGFLVLSEQAEFCYKCDDFYHPNDEGGLAWNDPTLAVDWPGLCGSYPGDANPDGYRIEGGRLILSDKDRKWPSWRELFSDSDR